jgi:ABC-2 type transport system permease protein
VIRLIGSEFLRARSRRVVPMMIVGSVFGVLVGVVIGAAVSPPAPTTEAIERADRRYERELERCLDGRSLPLEETGYPDYETLCADFIRADQYAPGGLRFADLGSLLDGTASLVVMLGALLGGTLGGGDWVAGTMTTLLTWEPRRSRVYAARSVAIAGTVFAISLLAQIWLCLAIAGAVAVKGTFALTPDGFLGDVAVSIIRISIVATLFSLIGLGFATVGRSSVAAVGAFLGYLVVFEGFSSAWVFGVAKIALVRAATVVTSGRPMQIPNTRPPRDATPAEMLFILQPGRAWITLLVWVVALWAAGLLAFRGRDVT